MPAKARISLAAASGVTHDHAIATDLLRWYDRHRRALPWRCLPGEAADPYRVWLSEIMLQQTTVQAVKPFYAKFLDRWPTVGALAGAPLEHVLRAWAGLGYYSRARNLHACATVVARQHDGRFPTTEAGLRALPGIGSYTAAAIAAIAFGIPATVVDGNVERVMARLFAIDLPLPRARPLIHARMAAATPDGRPGDFAQAVMDLGATICTPRSPACVICPLSGQCLARATGRQVLYPVRAAKRAKPVRYGTAYYVEKGDAVLVRSREAKGLLGGMTELPGSAWVENLATPLARPGDTPLGRVKHVFTHFTLMLDVVARDASQMPEPEPDADGNYRWVSRSALDQEALPTLMRNAIALARDAKTTR